jgi:uncharacterized protein YdeI (YjbR/CyaY-like superfamily)
MSQLKINNLEELENWLEKNYNQKESIWLIYPKKSKETLFGWSQVVDVLVCYGWIDSLPRKVDDYWTSLRISPRNPKSNWSRINKEKITRLQTQKKLHVGGLTVVDMAKKQEPGMH